jgi:hypothetical protein
MTPKEKEKELVNSFYNNAESRNKIGAFDEDLHQHNCKQCALIAVKFALENPLNSNEYNKYLNEIINEIELL